VNEPLAHSARPECGVCAQAYAEHVGNVTQRATDNAQKVAGYLNDGGRFFMDVVRSAACLHDLGKLDAENQAVLGTFPKKPLPVNHVDAGSARLLNLNWVESALLVYAHHHGLCSIPSESAKQEHFLRDPDVFDVTSQRLDSYVYRHEDFPDLTVNRTERCRSGWSGLTRRMALSCLVDADHGDTAQNYGNETHVAPPEQRWTERLQALDIYVQRLFQRDPGSARNQLRMDIYHACRNADIDSPIQACDSPVGTGKTTAVMAYLLQVAKARRLRHIFVVLPYTNIIKQAVDTYRKALVLAGESPEEVVAEHHHQADFSDPDLRQLATLWKAPVIVTTAVQFFETLGSNQPSRLRKLHELPGSAVFVDEAHAAIPSWLWPQTWRWLKELVQEWRCHFVLASGSLSRFWELAKFAEPPESVADLIPPKLRQRSCKSESRRVTYRQHNKPLDRHGLKYFVLSKPGPRLLILNTVQSAAVMAHELQQAGEQVLHLSTALVPDDRDRVVERVRRMLKFAEHSRWTLVATSCVEAGMDFSFRTAFRESCSVASMIQIGGRVNRHGSSQVAEIWDFRVLDPLLNRHPAFDTSRAVVDQFFNENLIDAGSATKMVTEAMRREIMSDYDTKADVLKKRECTCDYPEVAKLCRVIDADTRIVVIDQDLVKALENRGKVSPLDLLRESVQLWSNRIKDLALEPIRGYEELYKWTGKYDPDFLGYMEGVLPLVYAKEEGFIIV